MNEKPRVIVLWKLPLIEIIDDKIFIDDIMVWNNGQFVGRDDL